MSTPAQKHIAVLRAYGLTIPEIVRIAAVAKNASVQMWEEGSIEPRLKASCRLAQAAAIPGMILEQLGLDNHRSNVRTFFSQKFEVLEWMNPIGFVARYGEARPEALVHAVKTFAEAKH